ncbi:MAG: hypothetical protein ACHQET_09135 [Chitinophagales bacterium]
MRALIPTANKHSFSGLQWTSFALVVLYLLNCFSPLRLHYDSLRYFAIESCWQFGCPPNSDAAKDYLPYGYTVLLYILAKLGILKSFALNLINSIYLVLTIYFVKKICEPGIRRWIYILIVCLNWAIIKYDVSVLSEFQYMFFSIGSLYFFYQFTRNRNWLTLLIAFLFAALAFFTRTAGVALVPALFLGLAWEYRKELIPRIRKNLIWVLIILILIAGVFVFSRQLGLTHYTRVLSEHAVYTSLAQRFEWRFREWGELFVNIPIGKVINSTQRFGDTAQAATILFVGIGMLFFAWIIYAIFFGKSKLPFVVRAYFFFYSLILFFWPFNDPRFWVPVVPLVAAAIIQNPFSNSRVGKLIIKCACAVYLVLGIAAIFYSTYISFNKEALSKTTSLGNYRNEYETHFFGKPLSDTATHTEQWIVDLLNKHD